MTLLLLLLLLESGVLCLGEVVVVVEAVGVGLVMSVGVPAAAAAGNVVSGGDGGGVLRGGIDDAPCPRCWS